MFKNLLCLGLLAFCFQPLAYGQKQFFIAFYNQENLFDTIDDPHKNDNEFLPSAKHVWNTEKYTNKLNHMAKVIGSMNEGKGADVLGMCEVENAAVLADLCKDKQLAKMKYSYVHFESPDDRSIDNALLYQSKKFTVTQALAYPITFKDHPKSKTRDILLVKLTDKKTKVSFVVLVNHFPSRLGGQKESDSKRATAATVLRTIYDSISKADPTMSVIMMGDFNDEPTDASMSKVLQARGSMSELKGNDLFNTTYSMKDQKKGSYFYRNEWETLDQIILSYNMVTCTGKVCYKPQSVDYLKHDWMLETEGKYKGAPLRTFAGQKYLNGYSDHLPVYILIEIRK